MVEYREPPYESPIERRKLVTLKERLQYRIDVLEADLKMTRDAMELVSKNEDFEKIHQALNRTGYLVAS